MRVTPAVCVLGTLLMVFWLVPPAQGAWLVTTGGEELETRGDWQERGRLIVFTRPDGTLASIRASLIDLEQSRRRNETPVREPRPAAAPVEARQEPIAVLTDENLQLFGDGAGGTFSAADSRSVSTQEALEVDGSDPADQNTRLPSPAGLTVDDWRYLESDAGTEVIGVVRNNGEDIYANIELQVSVYGVDEELMTTRNARLANPILAPGRQSEFRLPLPQTYGVDRAEFNLTGVPFEARRPEGEEPIGGSTAAPTQPTGAGP